MEARSHFSALCKCFTFIGSKGPYIFCMKYVQRCSFEVLVFAIIIMLITLVVIIGDKVPW